MRNATERWIRLYPSALPSHGKRLETLPQNLCVILKARTASPENQRTVSSQSTHALAQVSLIPSDGLPRDGQGRNNHLRESDT